MVSGRPPRAVGAVIAALVVIVAIPNFGTDAESFRAGLRDALERMLRVQTAARRAASGRDSIRNALIDFLVIVMPPAAAVLATLTNAAQSLARRPRREGLRPPEAAMA